MFTSGASSFSRAWKRRVGIWLARNLRVEVVAVCLYSSSYREGGCSRKSGSGIPSSRKPAQPRSYGTMTSPSRNPAQRTSTGPPREIRGYP